MITPKKNLLLILLFSSLSSCLITNSARTTQIEIMKPGIFNIPKGQTIALFNRDLFQSDNYMFNYYNGIVYFNDTTINYHDLADTTVGALANYLKEGDYYRKVINYRDSLNYLFKDTIRLENHDQIFEQTRSDVCIFLDYILFNASFIPDYQTPFFSSVDLLWTIMSKNDSLIYCYKQTDTLYYDENQVGRNLFKNKIPKKLLENSCKYLGEFFGKKNNSNLV